MAAVINKRQQARNERALQELIKTVPGNDRCADCQARNPGWASWSLGIFLCMRCAALHRKLGTHISKVKSLSMDSWSNDQVDNMRHMGNTASNRLFNPQNVIPSIPLDMDEVDSAMERFVRRKYEQRAFSAGNTKAASEQHTGSTTSVEDEPPPLPPKPTKRFGVGVRAASSTFPMSRSDRGPAPRSPATSDFDGRDFAPRFNAVSRVMGATAGSSADNLESKLGRLREIGFPDDKRNLQVLKGLNGNIEKAIEALIRLGEGSGSFKARTPDPPAGAQSNGLFVPKTRATVAVETSSMNNPSGQTSNPQHQQAAPVQPSQPILMNGVQYPQEGSTNNPYNPFNQSTQPPQRSPLLEQNFQNLQIVQHHELVPNSSGSFPHLVQHHHNTFVRNSVPQTPQLPYQPDPFNSLTHLFPQQQVDQSQQSAPPLLANNPYLQSTTPQALPASHIFGPQNTPNNPYLLPYFQHQPFDPQHQQAPQSVPLQPHQPSSQALTSYFDLQTQSQQQHQQQQQAPQPTPFTHQQPIRHDKASILALYDYPHLAPVRPTASPLESPPSENDAPQSVPVGKQRSVTAPVGPIAGSMNPFMTSSFPAVAMTTPADTLFAETNGGTRHASQDSTDFKGFQNGRHSPDAFASLSARYVR